MPAEEQSLEQEGNPENDELIQLAVAVMQECRVSLMISMRFLDVALWHMPYSPTNMQVPLSTDGQSLLFEPITTMLMYKLAPNELMRDYLHTILHCIFRHPFDLEWEDLESWWLACDIMVESLSFEIAGNRYPCKSDNELSRYMDWLKKQFDKLSPFKIYSALIRSKSDEAYRESMGLDDEKIDNLHRLFERDDHSLWITRDEKPGDSNEGDGGNRNDEPGQDEERADNGRSRNAGEAEGGEAPEDQNAEESRDSESGELDGNMKEGPEGSENDGNDDADTRDSDASSEDRENNAGESDDDDADGSENGSTGGNDADTGESGSSELQGQADELGDAFPNTNGRNGTDAGAESDHSLGDNAGKREDAAREWEQIAKKVEAELESFSQSWGDKAGDLKESLSLANAKKVDYAKFIRSFSRISETLKVNDDEFDYIYYTYGLRRYGNMPLIDPLEYKEEQRIREFAIAVDTSESCSGDTIRMFLTRTFELLKESQGFGRDINVHIIECDAQIQSDTKITSVDQLDKFGNMYAVHGLGGTDFRPVFEYVDKLVETREFENLQGLIYFTDGMGDYPKKMPSYKCAFVFVDDGMGIRHVPPWAMKVLIDDDKIRQL